MILLFYCLNYFIFVYLLDVKTNKHRRLCIKHSLFVKCLLRSLFCSARSQANELISSASPVEIILSDFKGSLPLASGSKDSSCWTDPGGREFMVRGKTYSIDYLKVQAVFCKSMALF